MSFKEDLGKVVSCLTSPKAYSIYASVGVVVTALLSIRASKKNIEVAEELENKSKKELIKEAVLGAVSPTYLPQKSLPEYSKKLPLRNMPFSLRIFPITRATVVFPVPGFPTNLI